MNAIGCKSCKNVGCFVKLCSPDWLLQIDIQKHQVFYKKSQNIINQGAVVSGVYFIQKGKVKIFSAGINGKEQIVRFATDGHILGHRGIGNDVYPISAVTMDDSLVCFIRNDLLNEMFLANPKFPIELMMYYSVELRKVENRMKNIAQMNLREKTAETLLLLLTDFGVKENNELNVSFSREDIANTAGSTRQQVTMQLTEFEQEGFIKKRGKKIVFRNIEGLKKIICKFDMHIFKSDTVLHFANPSI